MVLAVLDEDDPHDEVVGEVFETMNHAGLDEHRIARAERSPGIASDERTRPWPPRSRSHLDREAAGDRSPGCVNLDRHPLFAKQFNEAFPGPVPAAGSNPRRPFPARSSISRCGRNRPAMARSASGARTEGQEPGGQRQ